MTSEVELDFRRVSPELESELVVFFEAVARDGLDRTFHPHPFDADEAHRLAIYSGLDEYHLALHAGVIAAYGMLRGWGEGYDVPSLGIAVDPEWQRRGIGRRMMLHLHEVARARGATRIRLKVYPDNAAAIALYESLGYVFGEQAEGQLVGVVTL